MYYTFWAAGDVDDWAKLVGRSSFEFLGAAAGVQAGTISFRLSSCPCEPELVLLEKGNDLFSHDGLRMFAARIDGGRDKERRRSYKSRIVQSLLGTPLRQFTLAVSY